MKTTRALSLLEVPVVELGLRTLEASLRLVEVTEAEVGLCLRETMQVEEEVATELQYDLWASMQINTDLKTVLLLRSCPGSQTVPGAT